MHQDGNKEILSFRLSKQKLRGFAVWNSQYYVLVRNEVGTLQFGKVDGNGEVDILCDVYAQKEIRSIILYNDSLFMCENNSNIIERQSINGQTRTPISLDADSDEISFFGSEKIGGICAMDVRKDGKIEVVVFDWQGNRKRTLHSQMKLWEHSNLPKEKGGIYVDKIIDKYICFTYYCGEKYFVGRMKKETSDLFRRLGITVDLTQPMKKMSVSQRQMCEIAKAISYHSKVIVLDEPTSSLTAPEVEKLFKMMRQLKAQGISLIYISHKMDEIFEICDEISVLRDGSLVMTKASTETDMNELIAAMVGRSLDNRFPPVDNTPGETILSVQNISTKYAPKLQNISFDIRKGEIFGFYGLVGAGRTELLETIFGIRTRAEGTVVYDGKLMNFSSPKDAMDHGFALITEERKANGLFLKGDITFNTTIANMNHYKSGIALSNDKMVRATADEIKVMHTKCMGPDDMISNLSGGNQQKAIFGKWLERSPSVFMMDDPTRGIDVGAKYEIYELIINMAKQGKTIIVVSSEMPEILGITNRIGVMSNGRLAGIVNTKETNQEELLRLSAKYL